MCCCLNIDLITHPHILSADCFYSVDSVLPNIMPKPRVLISGAGIAGTVLAYWLGKYGFQVVIVERAQSQKQTEQGQIIDVEGPAQEIVVRMGLLDDIKAESTHEGGLTFVDKAGRSWGKLIAGQTSLSNEIEIQRPALARILVDAAAKHEGVEIMYGTTIQSVKQTDTDVKVELLRRGDGSTTEKTFDILIASDGLRSKTRDMILDASERRNAIRSVGTYCAYFSVPAEERDRPIWRIYNMPGRKQFSIKPLTKTESSCYAVIKTQDPRFREARESRDVQKQKDIIAKSFSGGGWETNRVMRGMKDTNNFYFEEICQVMLQKWSKGRSVLAGDTAYAPSPLTGQGTNLAFIGAYVLASCIIRHPEDHKKAFQLYEEEFRPYVNKTQPIPLGGRVLYISLPLTIVGCWLLRIVAWFFLSVKLYKLFPEFGTVSYDLPDLK